MEYVPISASHPVGSQSIDKRQHKINVRYIYLNLIVPPYQNHLVQQTKLWIWLVIRYEDFKNHKLVALGLHLALENSVDWCVSSVQHKQITSKYFSSIILMIKTLHFTPSALLLKHYSERIWFYSLCSIFYCLSSNLV